MFKIVTGRTLTELRQQAAQVPDLRQQLATAQEMATTAQQAAEAARTDAEHARTELQLVENDRVIGLTALREAARDPQRRPSALGLIAVRILRGQVQYAKALAAENGGEVDPGLRFLEMLLGEDDGTVPAQDGTETGHSPVLTS